MDTVVVVPGIMGSDLWLGEERLWPPTIGISHRVDNPAQLLDPAVVTRDIIRRVMIFGFYEKLLQPLDAWGYTEGPIAPRSKGRVIPFPYNWTHSIPATALRLSFWLQTQVRADPQASIVLLAHSMGGLICTYALECLTEGDLSWRRNVRLFVTFGTPFHGAPEALLNAFGVEGVSGITAADCQTLMADPAFPSAYQLFPHQTTSATWQLDAPLEVVGDYQALDPTVSLGTDNVLAAIALQRALAHASAGSTRKFNFCGAEHKTVWAVRKAPSAGEVVPFNTRAGDGTVPSWSGRQDSTVQFAPLGAKHAATFQDKSLLDVLKQLLLRPPSGGGPAGGEQLQRRTAPIEPQAQPAISASLNAISSARASVEVEIDAPPLGGRLCVSWIDVENSTETPDELQDQLASEATAAGSSMDHPLVVLLDTGLEFPQRFMLELPASTGVYALAAWAEGYLHTPAQLDVECMDLVWIFNDSHGNKSHNGSPQSPPRVRRKRKYLESPASESTLPEARLHSIRRHAQS